MMRGLTLKIAAGQRVFKYTGANREMENEITVNLNLSKETLNIVTELLAGLVAKLNINKPVNSTLNKDLGDKEVMAMKTRPRTRRIRFAKESPRNSYAGRGSITSCGDVELNPGPNTPTWDQWMATTLVGETTGTIIPPAYTKPKPDQPKTKRSVGRGSIITCGDVESNPGPNGPAVVVPVAALTQKKKRKRRKRTTMIKVDSIPAGTVNAPGAGYVVPYASRQVKGVVGRKNQVEPKSRFLGDTGDLPNYVVGFLERHLDPCGEYRTQLDNGKIPDGAVPQSVSGQFREVYTIKHPLAPINEVELSGQTWALVLIAMPLWRHPLLMVAQMVKSEVDDDDMTAVALSFNNKVNPEAALYPNWVEAGEGLYWSLKKWTAFSNVPPPSELGISPFISSFRISGFGYEMLHNTPTLIDQGVVVASQYPCEPDVRNVVLPIDNNATTTLMSISGRRVTNSLLSEIVAVIPGFGNAPWRVEVPNVTFDIVGETVVDVGPVQYGGTLSLGPTYAAADNIEIYIVASGTGTIPTVALNLRVTGTTTPLLPVDAGWANSNASFGTTRQATDIVTLDEAVNLTRRVNVMTVPPVKQEDHIQETPKGVVFQLKDETGVYQPIRKAQPVFSFTKASDYGPVRFITPAVTATQLSIAIGTIQDTCDANFSYGVQSFTSLPYACQPYIKMIRSWEAIPSKGSPWGPFTTYTTPRDDIFMDVIDAFQDQDPFAYPAGYNGLGLMFAKVCKVVAKIPRMIRTGRNVADAVSQCVTDAQATISSGKEVYRRTKAGFREMRMD